MTTEEYTRRAKEGSLVPCGWVLVGRPGRGKSKAAAIAAAAYLRAGRRDVLWVSCREAVERVMEQRASEYRSELRDRILSVGLLVIDDLGTQRPDHSGEVEHWIYRRHAERRATLATINDPSDEAAPDERRRAAAFASLDDRIASRLADFELVTLEGPDYRQRRPVAV